MTWVCRRNVEDRFSRINDASDKNIIVNRALQLHIPLLSLPFSLTALHLSLSRNQKNTSMRRQQMLPGSFDVYQEIPEILHQEYYDLGLNQSFPSLLSSFNPPEFVGVSEEGPLNGATEAARNHREAEKRRRGRINSHLDRLRSILACDSKMDKASLLAKAVQHVKELKQRAAEIEKIEHFPSEIDEITVYSDTGRQFFTASLCCEDREGLLPELGETVKSLRLRILRAEMATLGGRVRNVLVVEREEDEVERERAAEFLKEALTAMLGRAGAAAEHQKRRRLAMEY